MNEINSRKLPFFYRDAAAADEFFLRWRNTYRIITKRRPSHRPPPVLESFSIVSLPREKFIESVAVGGVCVIFRFLFLLICRRRCVIWGGGGGGGLVSLVQYYIKIIKAFFFLRKGCRLRGSIARFFYTVLLCYLLLCFYDTHMKSSRDSRLWYCRIYIYITFIIIRAGYGCYWY